MLLIISTGRVTKRGPAGIGGNTADECMWNRRMLMRFNSYAEKISVVIFTVLDIETTQAAINENNTRWWCLADAVVKAALQHHLW